jgi:hypothetical protein
LPVLFIDTLPVIDPNHQDEQNFIVHFVNYPVIAGMYPVAFLVFLDFFATARPGYLRQRVQPGYYLTGDFQGYSL